MSLKSWKSRISTKLDKGGRVFYKRSVFRFKNMNIVVKLRIYTHGETHYSVETNAFQEGFYRPFGGGSCFKEAFTQFRQELKNPIKEK